ncbi:MAG: hypothetical protein Q8N99_01100 [Nanoarchaeota archaeon]|nr:hypothetical protein [Nanoarchaeota archaeon]
MVKPLAIIIDDKLDCWRRFGEILENHSLSFDYKYFDSLGKWKAYRQYGGRIPQVYFIGYRSLPNGGPLLANEISKLHPESAIVMMSTNYDNPILATIYNQNIDSWLDKPPEMPIDRDNVNGVIGSLRKSRKLKQKLSIGIIGCAGRLGNDILSRAYSDENIISIALFSQHIVNNYAGDYSELLKKMRIKEGAKEIVTFTDLEAIVSSEPDVLFITTGKHLDFISLKNQPKRKLWFFDNLPNIEPVLGAIARINPRSLVSIQTNPSGPNNKLAIEVYGRYPYFTTSLSADTLRHQRSIIAYLRALVNNALPKHDKEHSVLLRDISPIEIEMFNFGEHGDDLPHLKSVRIRGKSLEEYCPRILEPDSELRELLREDAEYIGTDGLKASLKKEAGKSKEQTETYPDTADAIYATLEDIATYQDKSRNSLHCWHDCVRASLNWPARFDFSSHNVKVYPDYERLGFEELSDEEREKIEAQIREQDLFVENRHNPIFFRNLK